ncbi:disulfide bond formation protein B [Candidatus Protochlamydia phocaeensis]|uniref:disulfide bond formation protein B n=1 Tax=Candidatus Protochlamydia phocaeensis TaxID=1414722 RepID=UPI000838A354|nr:disulfide bond formation protein B [Candidatus Protochlamydia phocaeensis]
MVIVSLNQTSKWNFDKTLLVLWIISALVLMFSLYQQFIAKVEPCDLCKWQRYVYILIFAISPLGLIQQLNFSIRNTISLFFLIGFGVASYHALVQFGLLADRCAITQQITSIEDFMEILDQPKISCSNISWKLFGLSASSYNAAFSFFALIILNFKTIKKLSYVTRNH